MTNSNADQNNNYAGFWVRVAAAAIDSIFLTLGLGVYLLVLAVCYPFTGSNRFLTIIGFTLIPITLLVPLLYYSYFNSEGRNTIGKTLLQIKTVDYDGNNLSFLQAMYRTIWYVFDTVILGVGNLISVFTKKKQTIHDMASRSLVVYFPGKKIIKGSQLILLFLAVFGLQYILILGIRNYAVSSYDVPTGSMKPTIQIGDFIWVDKVWPTFHSPKKGDIIVFKYPPEPEQHYIKRCVAIGGQMVEMRDNKLFVDGEPEGEINLLSTKYDLRSQSTVNMYTVKPSAGESYVIRTFEYSSYSMSNFEFLVPEGHFFALGDNRDNSYDSRSWGAVPYENIVGKAGWIWLSYDSYYSRFKWERVNKQLK